jgi:hypothetical protein
MLAVAGIVTLTNQLTKKQVKEAASMLPSQIPHFPVPEPFTQFKNLKNRLNFKKVNNPILYEA